MTNKVEKMRLMAEFHQLEVQEMRLMAEFHQLEVQEMRLSRKRGDLLQGLRKEFADDDAAFWRFVDSDLAMSRPMAERLMGL